MKKFKRITNNLLNDDNLIQLLENEAIKNMKELKNPFVDKAFFNNDYVICKKDKQVISFQYSSDKQINTIIEYYFK